MGPHIRVGLHFIVVGFFFVVVVVFTCIILKHRLHLGSGFWKGKVILSVALRTERAAADKDVPVSPK